MIEKPKASVMPSPKRRQHKVDYKHADDSSDDDFEHRRANRPRGYRPGVYREDSLVKRQAESDKVDSGWDTDSHYDPRDKYYLSADDDPFDLYTSERKSSTTRKHGSNRRSPSAQRSPDRGTSSRRAPSHPHSHGRSRHHSPSRTRPRDDKNGTTSRHKSTAATSHHSKTTSSSHAGHSRPKPSRASSSYLNTSRPRPTRAGSSYSAPRSSRPRPVRGLSHNSSQTKPKFPKDIVKILDPEHVGTLSKLLEDFPWEQAAKVALQAGTVAAIKVGTDSVPWPVKGTKIASAALGAAVVDHVFRPKKRGGVKYAAMRHLAELAVGNLVVGPAMGRAGNRGSGGSGRSGGGGGGGGGGRR